MLIASALLFLVSLSWAVLTPDLRAPDEAQHLNSIIRVADGGGWPAPGDAVIRSEVLDARKLAGATQDGRRPILPGSVEADPGAPRFSDIVPTGVDQRLSLLQLRQLGGVDRGLDQMTQHPPGYYAVTAAVYDLFGIEDWRYDRAIFFLRALTALTIALTVPVSCWLATSELARRQSWSRAASFLPLLIPQLAFIGGAVTNDGAATAFAAVLTAGLIRLTCSGPTPRRVLFVAVVAGLTCWTKGTALTLLPAIPLAIAIGHRRHPSPGLRGVGSWIRPALRDTIWSLALAFAIGGWWWALNLLRYGTVQPAGLVTSSVEGPTLGLSRYIDVFTRQISSSFFGDIGGLEVPLPAGLTATLSVVLTVLVLVALPTRQRMGDRVILVLIWGLTTIILFSSTYSAHLVSRQLPGLQGRYLFVILVPVLVLAAIGAGRTLHMLHVPMTAIPPLALTVGLGVSVTGLVLGYEIYYRESFESLGTAVDRFFAWSPWSPVALTAIPLVATSVLLLVAFWWGRLGGSSPTERSAPRPRHMVERSGSSPATAVLPEHDEARSTIADD